MNKPWKIPFCKYTFKRRKSRMYSILLGLPCLILAILEGLGMAISFTVAYFLLRGYIKIEIPPDDRHKKSCT